VLDSFNMGSRLVRGRRYARAGQVLELQVDPGEVRARVQGSRTKPYQVAIRVLQLSEKDWVRVEKALASRAIFLAKLLAGEMPLDIEDAFGECQVSLFPASARDLTTDCSCPDWANPCKHIAATYYLLAEAFDDDPFLILRWRGRTKEQLLDRLRIHGPGARGTPATPGWPVPVIDTPPIEESLLRFFDAGSELAGLRVAPQAAPVPEAILHELDHPAIDLHGTSLADVLVPVYRAMAAAAEARALGARSDESGQTATPRQPAS
jgi:uncharacterized Zn finger protein